MALTRQMIWRMLGASHPMIAHLYESRSLFERGKQADRVEGIQSFFEKRNAKFPNSVANELPQIWDGWHNPAYGEG